MAQPGARTRVRTMRQGLGKRMATPPRGPPLSPTEQARRRWPCPVARPRSTAPPCSQSSALPG
eukprot:441124-Lingulodinium_polyedra.AAC.1